MSGRVKSIASFSFEAMQDRIGTEEVAIYKTRTKTYKFNLKHKALMEVQNKSQCKICGRVGEKWELFPTTGEWAYLRMVDKSGSMIFWNKATKHVICEHCQTLKDRGIVHISLEEMQERFRTGNNKITINGRSYNFFSAKIMSGKSGIKRMMAENPVCVACGRQGHHWEVQMCRGFKIPRLHLVDETGMIFTRDHIIPRSKYREILGTKDGRDSIDNSQTMCSACNNAKADALPLDLPKIVLGRRGHQLPLIQEKIADNSGQPCQECDHPTQVKDEYLLTCTHCGQRHRRFIRSAWSYWQDQMP